MSGAGSLKVGTLHYELKLDSKKFNTALANARKAGKSMAEEIAKDIDELESHAGKKAKGIQGHYTGAFSEIKTAHSKLVESSRQKFNLMEERAATVGKSIGTKIGLAFDDAGDKLNTMATSYSKHLGAMKTENSQFYNDTDGYFKRIKKSSADASKQMKEDFRTVAKEASTEIKRETGESADHIKTMGGEYSKNSKIMKDTNADFVSHTKRSFTDAEDHVRKSSDRMGGYFKSAMAGAAAGAAASVVLGVTGKGAQFTKESIDVASHQAEVDNANERVLGKQGFLDVKKWSEDAPRKLLMSSVDAEDLVRVFVKQYTETDKPMGELIQMAEKSVANAADMSSFNDKPIQNAAEAIQSLMTNQSKPMRRYGVFSSQGVLEDQAVKAGIVSVNVDQVKLNSARADKAKAEERMANMGDDDAELSEKQQTAYNRIADAKKSLEIAQKNASYAGTVTPATADEIEAARAKAATANADLAKAEEKLSEVNSNSASSSADKMKAEANVQSARAKVKATVQALNDLEKGHTSTSKQQASALKEVENAQKALTAAEKESLKLDAATGATQADRDKAQADIDEAQARINNLLQGKMPELTQGQRMEAAYSLMNEKLDETKQTGDVEYSRPKSFANAKRELTARATNIKAAFGEGLLPAAVTVLRFIDDKVMPNLEKMAGGFGDFIGRVAQQLVGWLETSGPGFIDTIKGVFGWLKEHGPEIVNVMTRFGTSLGQIATVAAGLFDIFNKMPPWMQQAIMSGLVFGGTARMVKNATPGGDFLGNALGSGALWGAKKGAGRLFGAGAESAVGATGMLGGQSIVGGAAETAAGGGFLAGLRRLGGKSFGKASTQGFTISSVDGVATGGGLGGFMSTLGNLAGGFLTLAATLEIATAGVKAIAQAGETVKQAQAVNAGGRAGATDTALSGYSTFASELWKMPGFKQYAEASGVDKVIADKDQQLAEAAAAHKNFEATSAVSQATRSKGFNVARVFESKQAEEDFRRSQLDSNDAAQKQNRTEMFSKDKTQQQRVYWLDQYRAKLTEQMVIMRASGETQDKLDAKQKKGEATLRQLALQIGLTKDQADDYSKKLNNIPDVKKTIIQADVTQAAAAVSQWLSSTVGPNATDTFSLAKMSTLAQAGKAGLAQTKAGGGFISGAGTGMSDSIPAWLSNGEYVLRASAVRRIGVQNLDKVNDGYASGGVVGFNGMFGAALTHGGHGSGISIGNVNVVAQDMHGFERSLRARQRAASLGGRRS